MNRQGVVAEHIMIYLPLPGEMRASENSYFCQAARQLSSVPSSQLCVKLASGGDPTYAFNIRFTGEEVHGTSKWLLGWVQMHRLERGGGGGELKSKECPAGEKKCHKQVWWHNPVIQVIWGTKIGRIITS